MIFLPALLLGLAGSLHCVGMCGPIALAVPVGRGTMLHRTLAYSLYHFGRLTAYAILGFLFGVLGYGLNLAGFQQGLSLTAGVLMLILVWFPRLTTRAGITGTLGRFQSNVTRYMAAALRTNRMPALLGLGFFNGWLPCGMVYIALAASMTSINPFYGALFMAVFGLGTAPALILLGLTGNRASASLRIKLNKVVPVIATVFAMLFIIRGLGMGIPFLSPKLGFLVSFAQSCLP